MSEPAPVLTYHASLITSFTILLPYLLTISFTISERWTYRMLSTLQESIRTRWQQFASPEMLILIGLMAPSLLVGMNHHVFAVALPRCAPIRSMDTDTAAWASMIYSLPFMALMPLYGRLGDGLGKRRLLLTGMAIFLCGTVLVVSAQSIGWFMSGRVIQGIGTAGFVPLGMAIIVQWFPPNERGQALGAWNSIVPLSGLVFPFFGGLLVDNWGWRAIYPPILLTGIAALLIVRRHVPTLGQRKVDPAFLRTFDWVGVLLLTCAMSTLLFFASSRPITGVEGLHDWRLLSLCLLLFVALIAWERKRPLPYVNLGLFGRRIFSSTAFSAGLRMLLMSSISFVMPLYLTDIHQLNASVIGLAISTQAGMLFLISRAGGQLADRWGSRRPVLISMTGLLALMILLALAPATLPVWLLLAWCAMHGLVIGLSLAPLHRAALHDIPHEESGSAAGLYSMVRFAGQILGVAIAGVVLQRGLAAATAPVVAYQTVFWLYAAVAVVGILVSWGVEEA